MTVALAEALAEPLQLRFFQLGLAAAVLAMLAGAGIGFPVVLRREAYLGHGLGQAMIAGVAIGGFLDLPAALAALVGAAGAAALISVVGRSRLVGADTAIAVVTATAFALGVAVISSDRNRGVNVTNVLFGNVLGVSTGDVATLAAAAVLAWAFTWRTGRRLVLTAAAPQVARSHKVRVNRLELARVAVLAAVCATIVQVVGVTLVVVALVFPAGAATLVARTLAGVHVVSAGMAVFVGVTGMYVSYWYDLASGPAVVLTAAATWSAALAASSIQQRRGR